MPMGVSVPLTIDVYRTGPDGDSLVGSESFSQDVVKIGSLQSAHLKLDDASVSRMHAVIDVASADDVGIMDLSATVGTLVNGNKISSRVKLQTGDTIVLGATKLKINVGEPIFDDAPATQVSRAPEGPRSTVMGMAIPVESPHQTGRIPVQANVPVGGMIPPVAAPPAPSAHIPPPQAAIPAPTANIPPPQAAVAPPTQQRFVQPPSAAFGGGGGGGAGNSGGGGGADNSAVEVQDGSRAIEVAAMFEDAVIDVRHFTNPKSGEVSGATKGMLIGGALALLAAFIMFVISFVEVSNMRRQMDEWEAAGKPRSEFVTPREGPVKDILSSVFLIFGIFAMSAGIKRYRDEQEPRDFTIGTDEKALFSTAGDGLPAQIFPLVRSTGTDYELTYTSAMAGDVTLGNEVIPLAQLQARSHQSQAVSGAYAWTIPDKARVKIDLGNNTFLVNSVAPPRRYPVPLVIVWATAIYFIATAGAGLLFVGTIFSIPADAKSLSLDAFLNDQRFAQFLIKPPEEKEEIPDWLKKQSPDEAGGKGKRHKGEEGKMGKESSKNKTGLYALKGPQDNPDPHLAKTLAEEAAQKAGILGQIRSMEGSHIASIFGRDTALGTDASDVLGGLLGTQIGEAYGVPGGLGLVGSGKGGGGTGEGTIGLGGLGTIGKGGGGGSGSGYGRGAGGLGTRRAGAPEVVPGTAQVRGSLDKEIIRRVIRRHMNEIKFCYEKELLKNANLYGRVMVQFTISGEGRVVASIVQNSTMGNPTVEQCMAQSVLRWEFPKPEGGGIVVVSYPFVLKAAGAGE